jgi:hypothetical protein
VGMSVYLCMVPFTSILNFLHDSNGLCLRLQLLIDSLPCFMTPFQGYLPLQLYISVKEFRVMVLLFLLL